MKKLLCISLLLASLLFGVMIWRAQGRVLAQASAPNGVGHVVVRKVFWNPWSIGGLLGEGEFFIRADYHRHPGGPVYSSIGHYGESFYPSSVEVRWNHTRQAEVVMDGVSYMFLAEENWLWSDPIKRG